MSEQSDSAYSWEDYRAFAAEAEINDSDYEKEELRTHGLIGKWKTFYVNEWKVLQKLERLMARVTLDRTNYYSGKTATPFELKLLKGDVAKFVAADSKVQALQERIDNQQALVDYIGAIFDSVQKRGFSIRGAREWHIWVNGGQV